MMSTTGHNECLMYKTADGIDVYGVYSFKLHGKQIRIPDS